MSDIDTIREALEHEKVITRLKPDYFRMLPDAQGEYVYFGHQQAAISAALAALERVSALQAAMEAAMEAIIKGWQSNTLDDFLFHQGSTHIELRREEG